jgi:hypothetical protein
MTRPLSLSLAACALLALAACSSAPQSPDSAPEPDAAADASDSFLAFAASFQGFQRWDHYPAPADQDAGAADPVHVDPTLIEYVNHRAPPGNAPFPVGTMIVKEGTQGDPLQRQFFAMVKRGGDYNATGAIGWEWFELQNVAEPAGSVSIVWRGFGPPEGEIYGGNAKAGCNECHVTAEHDAVFAPEAQE